MKRNYTDSTRELGLDLTLLAARHLFQTDHLHFGYWSEGVPVQLANLKRAQEKYSDLLFENIPAGTKTILDVGSGTGAFACRLMKAGYAVDCVSPSASQTERLRTILAEGLGDRAEEGCIFECRYEDLRTERRYDLILFSESFQYIPLDRGLAISCHLLKPGGHVLICDFFRHETPDRGPFGGGHKMNAFQKEVGKHPLTPLTDLDITDRMAPNLDMVADFVDAVVIPGRKRLFGYLEHRYRVPFRIVTWLFRKKLRQAETKYMTGQRRSANFKVYKTYRLLRLRFDGNHQASSAMPHAISQEGISRSSR